MGSFLEIFDIYLLEAMVNGILLGGVLALLALGLNLIFGVIDVTWICYAELVMIGMYGMYYLVQYYGLSYYLAAPMTILLVAAMGALLHYLVIEPLLGAAPINQLLATGGVGPLAESFRVTYVDGGVEVTDGPFAEAKELVGGWALIDVLLVMRSIWPDRMSSVIAGVPR